MVRGPLPPCHTTIPQVSLVALAFALGLHVVNVLKDKLTVGSPRASLQRLCSLFGDRCQGGKLSGF